MIKNLGSGGVIVTGKEDIERVRVLALRGRMRLELLGLRFKGRSVFAAVKRQFNLSGTRRQAIYAAFCRLHNLEE